MYLSAGDMFAVILALGSASAVLYLAIRRISTLERETLALRRELRGLK